MNRNLPEPPPPDAAGDAIFLDFDGTLVPLAHKPDAVDVPAALISRLERLSDLLEGRLALVSGRAIEVLDQFGLANLSCAGSHGAEWRLASGRQWTLPRPSALDTAREAFTAFASGREGVLFEDKPLGAALHFRLAPDHGPDCIALAEELTGTLHLQHGHAMIELRVPGVHKGTAIGGLMQQEPFAGHRPVFVGDDVTDEDGFATVARLGGHGVLVGPPRETTARFGLPDPQAVNTWLDYALEPAR